MWSQGQSPKAFKKVDFFNEFYAEYKYGLKNDFQGVQKSGLLTILMPNKNLLLKRFSGSSKVVKNAD